MEKKKSVKKKPVKKTQEEVKVEELLSPGKYIGVGVLLLAVVLVTFTLANMYGGTKNIDYSKGYLADKKIVPEITCSDLKNAITGEKSFIFVTNYNSEEEYKLEKELKSIIGEYRLENEFFVFPVNSECGSLSDIESGSMGTDLKLPEAIDTTPTILYYKDGEFVDYVKRVDQQMIEGADFVKLLDIYEITK